MATMVDRDNCTVFHQPGHDFTILGLIITPMLAASGLLIIAGCVVGIGGCYKKTYKATLLISTGVVVRLAKIPGVNVKIGQDGVSPVGRVRVSRNSEVEIGREPNIASDPSSITGGNDQDQQLPLEGSDQDQQLPLEGSDQDQQLPLEEIDEWQNDSCTDGLRKWIETLREGFLSKREKKRKYFREQQEKTVFFAMNFGHTKLHFWVMPIAAPLLLATGGVLVLSYVSIFLTDQWEMSQVCKETNAFGIAHNCYRGFDPCPPLNCTAWDEFGMKENLFCVTETFDLFSPLIKIVSLLSVQVFLLELYACVFNKGCCSKGLRYPPCRYTCLCSLHLGFICAVILVMVILLATATQDEVKTFVTFTVPFLHVLFVSLAEWLILFVFTTLLWMIGPYEHTVNRRPSPCCCCLKRISPEGLLDE